MVIIKKTKEPRIKEEVSMSWELRKSGTKRLASKVLIKIEVTKNTPIKLKVNSTPCQYKKLIPAVSRYAALIQQNNNNINNISKQK